MRSAAALLLNLRYAFRPRKPLLNLRLAREVTQRSVSRRPRLRYVDFAVDFACNLRCDHCFAESLRREDRPRMGVEDYARAARACMRLGAVNFSFQGGEPLLFPDLAAIVASCRPERNLISVSTNGTLLTEARVEELVWMGVDILTVSLDSADAREHDRFRGVPGSFQKTLAGILRALDAGMHVTLGTVVTHQSLHTPGIRGLVRLARQLRLILYMILPVPAGRWSGSREMLLTEADLSHIEDLTRRTPYVRTDLQANLGGYGCGAAKEILYLTPYGDVLACPFLHVSGGNVLEEPVDVIRQRMLASPWFARYHPRCLVSTDREFVDRVLSRTWGAAALPLAWEDVFSLPPAGVRESPGPTGTVPPRS